MSGRVAARSRWIRTLAMIASMAVLAGGVVPGVPGWSGVTQASPGIDQLERPLLEQASSFDCRGWRQADEPFEAGAQAAIRCPSPAHGVKQLALFAFFDADKLGSHFRQRLRRIDQRPSWRANGCADGRDAVTTWRHGRLVCWIGREGSPIARMRWTDERTLTYGVADAAHGDIAKLYDWWSVSDLTPDVIEPEPVLLAEDFALDPLIPATRDERVAYLLSRVGDHEHPDRRGRPTTTRCRAMEPDVSSKLEPISLAGIACERSRHGRSRHRLSGPIRYFLFPSAEGLDAWWSRTLSGPPGGPIETGSGSFETCFSRFGFLQRSRIAGETAWQSREGDIGGRVACWFDDFGRRGLRWTVDEQLIGGSGTAAQWFAVVHPDRIQAYAPPPAGETVPSFADAETLSPLPRDLGAEEPPHPEAFMLRPKSVPGLPVGVIHPVAIEQCSGFAGFPADVDGSFWQATGGADANGRPIRFADRHRGFPEGIVVEFLKTAEDEAQMRSPGGYVVAYVRHEGPRRFRQGCS